jgi:hypothetical protein
MTAGRSPETPMAAWLMSARRPASTFSGSSSAAVISFIAGLARHFALRRGSNAQKLCPARGKSAMALMGGFCAFQRDRKEACRFVERFVCRSGVLVLS